MIINTRPVSYTIVELTRADIIKILEGKTIYQLSGDADDSYSKSALICCYCSDPPDTSLSEDLDG